MAQQVKIMPLGNSITYDNHSNDTRNESERIGYRFKLYQLLKAKGVDFDFIGNRDAGNDYFQDAEYDDVAGFPGITDDQMVQLINTGFNDFEDVWEAPGPYLNYYNPDIILLHIGTNALTESSADVEQLLTRIRFYDPNVIILVAKIINRKPYHAATTVFNNNVASYVNGLEDPKIIMVDMENGADINYDTEMFDEWHPYQSGYNKMALKWFEALMSINSAPEISEIPTQVTTEGSVFSELDLKNYVSDAEQVSSTLTDWEVQYSTDPKLSIVVNNGVATASILDEQWSGKDTVLYKITDNGNGAFKFSDSIYVVYQVIEQNDPPVCNAIVLESIKEDSTYTLKVSDFDIFDSDNELTDISVLLKHGTNYQVISENKIRPDENYTGSLTIGVQFYDLLDTSILYNYTITVENVNDPPVIEAQLTYPEVAVGKPLVINKSDIQYYDVDSEDNLIELIVLPGEGYTIQNNIVYMEHGVSGYHNVNIKLYDSDDSSDVFQFVADVIYEPSPPVFITKADTIASENLEYEYFYNAVDSNGDEITYSLERHPDFIDIDLENKKVFGLPEKMDIGKHIVEISATDGVYTVYQEYNLTVVNINDKPYFVTSPITQADDYESFLYEFSGEDNDGDSIYFFIKNIPDWLEFEEDSNRLIGYPQWDDADKVFEVVIGLSDNKDTVFQDFNIFVANDNSLPVLQTYPNEKAYVDSSYVYNLTYFDLDEDDNVQISVYKIPEWLNFDNDQLTFYGIPGDNDIGTQKLIIGLNDGRTLVSQSFDIDVQLASDIQESIASGMFKIYPNPFNKFLNIEINESLIDLQSRINIYNSNGILLKQLQIKSSMNRILVEDLPSGIYYVFINLGNGQVIQQLLAK